VYVCWGKKKRERQQETEKHELGKTKKAQILQQQQQGPMKALHNILLSSCSRSSSYTLEFGFVCLFVVCACDVSGGLES